MKVFELTPTNGRKSFGGKAKVIIDNGKAQLLSYTTIVAEFNTQTNEFKQVLQGKLSNTTSSHLKAFKNYYSIPCN